MSFNVLINTLVSQFNKSVNLPNESLVLVEGIFLQREEWRHFFDLVIFIDCSRELRYERVLERDEYIGDFQERLHKYKRRYWPGEEYYLNTVQPLKKADFLFNAQDLEDGLSDD